MPRSTREPAPVIRVGAAREVLLSAIFFRSCRRIRRLHVRRVQPVYLERSNSVRLNDGVALIQCEMVHPFGHQKEVPDVRGV